jgi:hypothetical protein
VALTKASSIKVNFNKLLLSDVTDVDHYLGAMRELFIKELEAGKQIQV